MSTHTIQAMARASRFEHLGWVVALLASRFGASTLVSDLFTVLASLEGEQLS